VGGRVDRAVVGMIDRRSVRGGPVGSLRFILNFMFVHLCTTCGLLFCGYAYVLQVRSICWTFSHEYII
jgi:hypothetical protein